MTHAHDPVDRAPGQVNVNAGTGRTVADPVVVAESPLAPIRRAIGLIFGVIVALIGLRILLLVLGANDGNAIVDGIYSITEIFVAPFRGVFSIDVVRPEGRSVFDIAAVVAIVGWSLIALLITAILRIPDRTA